MEVGGSYILVRTHLHPLDPLMYNPHTFLTLRSKSVPGFGKGHPPPGARWIIGMSRGAPPASRRMLDYWHGGLKIAQNCRESGVSSTSGPHRDAARQRRDGTAAHIQRLAQRGPRPARCSASSPAGAPWCPPSSPMQQPLQQQEAARGGRRGRARGGRRRRARARGRRRARGTARSTFFTCDEG